ncbi:MAG: VOC family protein [Chloroflexi bacterium]|nr:VOC family protein [Chloroflexota bacterium]
MATIEHMAISTTPETFAATVKFYTTVFGMKVIREVVDAKGRNIAFVSDGQGGRIEIMAYGLPAVPAPNHLAFGVSHADFDATVERLKASGVNVEPPMPAGSADRLGYFDDPAGNRSQIVARTNPLPK